MTGAARRSTHRTPARKGGRARRSSRYAHRTIVRLIVPRHYSLSLDLRRGERTFSGRVVIEVEDGAEIDKSFAGTMNTASRGLYAGDGFVVSQFQPNYAQDVFPCVDDPRLNAAFDIHVTSDP